jgi:hypothetical protein
VQLERTGCPACAPPAQHHILTTSSCVPPPHSSRTVVEPKLQRRCQLRKSKRSGHSDRHATFHGIRRGSLDSYGDSPLRRPTLVATNLYIHPMHARTHSSTPYARHLRRTVVHMYDLLCPRARIPATHMRRRLDVDIRIVATRIACNRLLGGHAWICKVD